MNVAVLGSGFGLYGYLPALQALPCRVLLPERYRAIVESREELSGFAAGIVWVTDERTAIDLADAFVVARRPADQGDLITGILQQPKPRRLLLEKPLAPNPMAAAKLQDQIEASGKIIRMGYSFGFTGWGQNLALGAAASSGDIWIRWLFRAHHYATNQSNWKRFEADGGGALRFYGIQLISLLANLGFNTVSASRLTSAQPSEAESWRATLLNHKGARCHLELDSNSAQTCFTVDAPMLGLATSLPDPFGDGLNGNQDRRVPVLSSLCREFLTAEYTPHPSYRKTIALWQAVEDVTVRDNVTRP
jgi:predicted dehydrogenase